MVKGKPRVFNFHYNKPASKAAGRNILTVHYMKQCLLVEEIDCQVPVKTKSRKRQPHCVMQGRGVVSIIDGVAVITEK